MPTKLYKGNHFSKQTSRRMDFKGKDGPGPGEYEPYNGPELIAENLNMPEDKQRFEARLPRYHEVVVRDEEKKVDFFFFSLKIQVEVLGIALNVPGP